MDFIELATVLPEGLTSEDYFLTVNMTPPVNPRKCAINKRQTQIIALTSPWVEYSTYVVSLWVDFQGLVHISGRITGGNNASVALNVASGYRPSIGVSVPIACETGNVGRIGISTNGNMTIYYAGSGWVSLDGVIYQRG
jgi:hypothetical protein